MNKKHILFIIITIFFTIPMVYAIVSEIDLTGLINDLSSGAWIGVEQGAIWNGTTQDIRLNKSGTGISYTDFTTWTESDGLGKLSQTATRSIFTDLERDDPNHYLYLDSGAQGNIDDFLYNLTLYVDAIESSASTRRMEVLTVSQGLGSWETVKNNNFEQAGFELRSASSTTKFYLVLAESINGARYFGAVGSNTLDIDTLYYCTIEKAGTSLKLWVFTDAARTNMVAGYNPQSITLHADHTFRYWLCPQSTELSGNPGQWGYIENLWLGAYSGGYQNAGLLYTANTMENTTSQAQGLILNTTIPDGTTARIDISDDNVTWIKKADYDQTGSYYINLKPQNLTDLYLKFFLNTTDGTKTPEIDYIQIQCLGTGTAAESKPYIFAALFIICGLAAGMVISHE